MDPMFSRRRLLGAAAALGLAGVAAACGDDSEPTSATTDAPAPGDTAKADAGAFPVTVEHAFGSTTIEQAPKRVFTLGYTDHDYVLALGVVPVGLQQWISSYRLGVGPFAEPHLNDHKPFVIPGATAEIPFEQVASQRPDLIIAIYRDLKDTDYKKLSAIAPTVAAPKGVDPYSVPLRDTALLVGQALGQEAAAEKLVSTVDQAYAKQAAAHPEFKGKTAQVVMDFDKQIAAYTAGDPRSQAMTSLGFTFNPRVDALGVKEFYSLISQERLDLIESDLLVVIEQTGNYARVKGDPLFQQLSVVKDGHVVYLDLELVNAFSHNDVLSVPWTLDKITPLLSKALRA
ncbi:ABC transporter substrate-binding protein [Flindersiella endophytica]